MRKLNVSILHPDLGIGGAERLIVDVALALKDDHFVSVFSSHYDPSHCFEETNSLSITVVGDSLPRALLGKFYILCSMLRQLWLVIWMIWTGVLKRQDLIILDQLSYCIPLIQLFKKNDAKVVFYCHFPDQLLASHQGTLRRIYRSLWDSIEEWSTGEADVILVNSKFTRGVVKSTFSNIAKDLQVVYPCVPELDLNDSPKSLLKNDFFLSINRFERKKGIGLAIKSYYKYLQLNSNGQDAKLVISGGYDLRVNENIEYLRELQLLCDYYQLKHSIVVDNDLIDEENCHVLFWPNVTSETKASLLKNTTLLLYTPRNEHFGIVPIEAMRMGTLVVTDNTGGPLETVADYYTNPHEFTGFNVDINDEDKWASTLELATRLKSTETQYNCQQRVSNLFSSRAMKKQLFNVINSLNME